MLYYATGLDCATLLGTVLYTAPCHTILNYTILQYKMHDPSLYCTGLFSTPPNYTICTVLPYTVSHYVTLHFQILYYAILCYTVLVYTTTHNAMLTHIPLCCARLRCVQFGSRFVYVSNISLIRSAIGSSCEVRRTEQPMRVHETTPITG